jgi:hypothetical protein
MRIEGKVNLERLIHLGALARLGIDEVGAGQQLTGTIERGDAGVWSVALGEGEFGLEAAAVDYVLGLQGEAGVAGEL